MTETFGALSFPLAAPVEGVPFGDPALYYVGQFLKAAINAAVNESWRVRGVSPKTDAVSFVFFNDPAISFEENRLPALYLFRASGKQKSEAEDYQSDTSSVNCWWVIEDSQDDHYTARYPMANAVLKSALESIFLGRDPAWVVDGDTDPSAATLGSFLLGYAGINLIYGIDSKPLTLKLEKIDGRGDVIPYYGLAMTLGMVELSGRGVSSFSPNAADGTITTNSDLTQETIYGTPAA